MAYAIDPDDASKLWAQTERLLGRRMTLDGN